MKTFGEVLKGYDYILEIKHPDYNGSYCEEAYLNRLKEWGKYEFTGDEIKYCGEILGTYEFIKAGEIIIPDDYPKLNCQFNNFSHGFFCFEIDKYNYKVDMEDMEYFVIANIKESMGIFAGVDDNRQIEYVNYYSCVEIKQYDIDLGKYNFDDGSELLSREDETYCKYVIEELLKSYNNIGLNAWISTKVSCHNPFDYLYIQIGNSLFPAIFHLGNDSKIIDYEEVRKLLSKTYFRIWAYNFSIVDLITQKWVLNFDD